MLYLIISLILLILAATIRQPQQTPEHGDIQSPVISDIHDSAVIPTAQPSSTPNSISVVASSSDKALRSSYLDKFLSRLLLPKGNAGHEPAIPCGDRHGTAEECRDGP